MLVGQWWRRKWLRKRRLSIQGQPVGHYTYSEAYDRYGATCYLCLQPIDRALGPNGYLAPSLDHVVPISRGGADTMENVRPCHKGCNSHKGKRLLSEIAA